MVSYTDGAWQFAGPMPWEWRIDPTTLQSFSFFAPNASYAVLGDDRVLIPLGCLSTRGDWEQARLGLLTTFPAGAIELAHRLAKQFGQAWGAKPLASLALEALQEHVSATGPSLLESVVYDGVGRPALAGAFGGELYWEIAPSPQGYWLYAEVLQPELFASAQAAQPALKARWQSHLGWEFEVLADYPRAAHLLLRVIKTVGR